MSDYVGVKLVAHAPLKWTRDGELVAIEPGDVFEIDERDLEITQARPELWMAAGAVTLYREPKATKPAGGADSHGESAKPPPGTDGPGRPWKAAERPPRASGEVVA